MSNSQCYSLMWLTQKFYIFSLLSLCSASKESLLWTLHFKGNLCSLVYLGRDALLLFLLNWGRTSIRGSETCKLGLPVLKWFEYMKKKKKTPPKNSHQAGNTLKRQQATTIFGYFVKNNTAYFIFFFFVKYLCRFLTYFCTLEKTCVMWISFCEDINRNTFTVILTLTCRDWTFLGVIMLYITKVFLTHVLFIPL